MTTHTKSKTTTYPMKPARKRLSDGQHYFTRKGEKMTINDTIDDMADRLREDLRSMVEKDAAAAARREVWDLEVKFEKLERAFERLYKLIEERYSYPGAKLPEECRYE